MSTAPRRVDILVVPVGGHPVITTIEATLEAQQAIVGGLIQPVTMQPDGLSVVVNKEGLILGLPTNRKVSFYYEGDDEITDMDVVGPMYFARWDADGEITSLRLGDIPVVLKAIGGS